MINLFLNLQLFADAGNLVNATGNYVNAYTGTTTAFSGTDTLTPTMKTYYDTELLENAREKLVFQQLGRVQSLPANHGKTVEWRKWNELPDVAQLTEGVIPTGQKLGMTSMTVTIDQYGEYVAITDQLDLHAIDDAILGATEELGAAGGKTYDKLVRNKIVTENSNKIYPAGNSAPTTLVGNKAYVSADLVNQAVTWLQQRNAPTFSGNKYVCVIHPSCTYDLRKDPDWVEAHKYSATTEIFNGEIGELHGMRFIQTTLAPVITTTGGVYYQLLCFGKDAFGVVDPAGAGMETIIKDKAQVGGPLNQFSTVGTKFSMAAKILYPTRIVAMCVASSYSASDAAN